MRLTTLSLLLTLVTLTYAYPNAMSSKRSPPAIQAIINKLISKPKLISAPPAKKPSPPPPKQNVIKPATPKPAASKPIVIGVKQPSPPPSKQPPAPSKQNPIKAAPAPGINLDYAPGGKYNPGGEYKDGKGHVESEDKYMQKDVHTWNEPEP